MRICLMIEGQEDVTWEQWKALAEACESSGIEALFRSDHYLSVSGRTERGSLDAWTTLAGLAAITERIKLGALVSPATFRHPSALAKSVVTVDHISGGRVELGLGAGWLEAEHRAYGFPFAATPTRLEVLGEQLEIVRRSWERSPFTFEGRHYHLQDLDALPKPVQQPHPNLIVGGSGGRKSTAFAARWADEYNTVFASPEECARRKAALDDACEAAGRSDGLTFSLMTGCLVGADEGEVLRRAEAVMDRSGRSGSPESWLEGLRDEWVAGTIDQAADKLGRLRDAGVERVMLQHQAHEDVEMVALLGEELAPALW